MTVRANADAFTQLREERFRRNAVGYHVGDRGDFEAGVLVVEVEAGRIAFAARAGAIERGPYPSQLFLPPSDPRPASSCTLVPIQSLSLGQGLFALHIVFS